MAHHDHNIETYAQKQSKLIRTQERALLATVLFGGLSVFGLAMIGAAIAVAAPINLLFAVTFTIIALIKTGGSYSIERGLDRQVKAQRSDYPDWFTQLNKSFDHLS